MTDGVRVLAVNAGSSSLKFGLYDGSASTTRTDSASNAGYTPETRCVAKGAAQHIGSPDGTFRAQWNGQERIEPFEGSDHGHAARRIVRFLRETGSIASGDPIVAAHRIVHGGAKYAETTIVDDEVLREISALSSIAPLHDGPACAALQVCRAELGDAFQTIAVFDTTFHARLPDYAGRYAIPFELAERHGIRRFGFHGLAHRWMAERFAALQEKNVDDLRVVTLQLGSGCSAAAIRAGRSVDVSMGFSPLEGLMMSTRSGDVDPAVVALLVERENVSAATVESWLNTRSGLLGVSGLSSDLRELQAAELAGHERAKLAIDMFCHRACKYLGAYLAVLGGADGIVFGGGVGENAPLVRARIAGDLDRLGVVLDDFANASAVGTERKISAFDSRTAVWVIPVDEELLIARDALRYLATGMTTTVSRATKTGHRHGFEC